jgi:hypothetical protein
MTKEGRGASWESPFTLADEDHSFRSMVRRLREQGEAKLGKTPELWITEFGCPVRKDISENVTFALGSGTEEEVAAILVRAFLGAEAAGVKVMTWFSFWDGPDGPMGLLAKDGRKRKAYYAFKTMSEQLGDYTLLRQVAGATHPTTGVQAYLFRSPTGHKLVVWNMEGEADILTKGQGNDSVRITDVQGQAVPVQPAQDGRVRLRLSPSPIYITGLPQDLTLE